MASNLINVGIKLLTSENCELHLTCELALQNGQIVLARKHGCSRLQLQLSFAPNVSVPPTVRSFHEINVTQTKSATLGIGFLSGTEERSRTIFDFGPELQSQAKSYYPININLEALPTPLSADDNFIRFHFGVALSPAYFWKPFIAEVVPTFLSETDVISTWTVAHYSNDEVLLLVTPELEALRDSAISFNETTRLRPEMLPLGVPSARVSLDNKNALSLASAYKPQAGQVFVGRDATLLEVLQSLSEVQTLAIVGIPGIGKTAFLHQLWERLEDTQVFFYQFQEGLVSLRDVLLNLAQFFEEREALPKQFAAAIRTGRLPLQQQAELMASLLLESDYYLLFDSLHVAEAEPGINSFFKLLQSRQSRNRVILASRTKPIFYSGLDEAQKHVKTIELRGLTDSETAEYFGLKGVVLNESAVEAIHERFEGFPLALEWICALHAMGHTEDEFTELINRTEGQLVEHLFVEIFDHLEPNAKRVLLVASLLPFPFSRSHLLDCSKHIFAPEELAVIFAHLCRQFLIEQLGDDLYDIHEIVRTLTLNYSDGLDSLRTKLADYLLEDADNSITVLEAFLLYFKTDALNKAAEVLIELNDSGLMLYYPDLAKTLLDRFDSDKVSPQNWMRILDAQGQFAFHWRKYETAQTHYNEMLQIAQELEATEAVIIAQRGLGNAFLNIDAGIAERYYLNGLANAKQLDSKLHQLQLYNNLGTLYIQEARYPEAAKMLSQGLELLDLIPDGDYDRMILHAGFAYLYAEQELWQKADDHVLAAYSIAEKLDLPYDIAKLSYNLGLHKSHQEEEVASNDMMDKAFEIAGRYGFRDIQTMVLTARGVAAAEKNNYDAAIRYFEEAAAIHERIDDTAQLATTYFDIGSFYWKLSNEQRAIEYYKKGFDIFENLRDAKARTVFLVNCYLIAVDSPDPRRITRILIQLKNRLVEHASLQPLAQVYNTLGRIYLDVLQRDRVAFACFQREISLLSDLHDVETLATKLIDYGVTCEKRRRFRDAFDAYAQSIRLAGDLELPELLAIAEYNRGNCFAECNLLDAAENDLRNALTHAKVTGPARLAENVAHNLGEVLRRQEKYDEGIRLLENIVIAARQRSDHELTVTALNNLGLAYEQVNNDNAALAAFQEARELSRRYYLRRDEANVLVSLGNFYFSRSNLLDAQECYKQGLEAAQSAEDVNLEEGCILSLGYVHRELGSLNSIEAELTQAMQRASDLNHYDNLWQFFLFSGETSLQLGDVDDAAYAYEKALELAMVLGITQFAELPEELGATPVEEIFETLIRMVHSMDDLLAGNRHDHASRFYSELCRLVSDIPLWQGHTAWFFELLAPIESYLRDTPNMTLTECVRSAWLHDT
ncbi:tetratricopeptide repeat protein [Aggregatilinea lenta]|uniref:tetratricopeptide repeat protein n=1 Tax=Aggregatilinea lenta TaxID=913108 RepID=UPI000E5B630A|nr:tetratricopeptide repeat protein [Aggregatilinea lenta]